MAKLTTEEMIEKIRSARSEIMGKSHYWQHYKGGVYQVDDFDIDTEQGDIRVRYHRIEGPDFNDFYESEIRFSRPLSEWQDDVEIEGLGAPTVVKRFIAVKPRKVTLYVAVNERTA